MMCMKLLTQTKIKEIKEMLLTIWEDCQHSFVWDILRKLGVSDKEIAEILAKVNLLK